ncbi:hypothetical protein FF38_02737 [Lucilia cuprina]|uniref:Uncharacterized protein n=1 Tax=Lucilia cuprina TaxID=7375 RepID=A0A0L0CSW1_LUCCU|nr:uncharacterized protein LOC111681232 [Lucilia cuprina]KAI8130695.1 hypothetical protein CVS40_0765 [Lucilia cuprina]KNC34494.1 hypothetical protein FF38_02737 [Lucilia cuprina]
MFKFVTCCLIINALLAPFALSQNNNVATDVTTVIDVEIQEAFKFSNVVSSSIEEYIREALPSEARLEGEKILQDVKEGLITCESFVHTPLDIWQYKVCSSSLLRDGMAALGALQAKYRPFTSGASRIGLFW